MSEGPPDDQNRLRLVPEPGTPTPPVDETSSMNFSSVPTAGLGSPDQPATLPWGATVTIQFPDGVARHPRLLDLVEDELGGQCVVVERYAGVQVGFGASGKSEAEALVNSEAVAHRLLGRLGLGHDHAAEIALRDRVHDDSWVFVNLHGQRDNH